MRIYRAPEGGDEGGGTPSWRESLPEEIRSNPVFDAIKQDGDAATALNEMATMTISAQRMVGADKVAVPSKDSSDQDRRDFYTKIGCPAAVDGYVAPTEGMPEGVTLDAEQMSMFGEEAHRIGLTDQQYAALVRFDATRASAGATAFAEAADKATEESAAALRKEWGDGHDDHLALANLAVDKLGGDELRKWMDETGKGNNIPLIKAFAKAGKFLAQDEVVGAGARASFTMTPDEANSEITRLEGDDKFQKAWTDRDHVGHAAAVEEMAKLHKLSNPPKRLPT